MSNESGRSRLHVEKNSVQIGRKIRKLLTNELCDVAPFFSAINAVLSALIVLFAELLALSYWRLGELLAPPRVGVRGGRV